VLQVHLCSKRPRYAGDEHQQEPSHIQVSSAKVDSARHSRGADALHLQQPA